MTSTFLNCILLSLLFQAESLSSPMTSHQKLLCVGISTLDTIATIDTFPTPDAKLRSTSLTHAGGGNAANTAFCIATLGVMGVDLVTSIGTDGHGDMMMKELQDGGVGVHETTVERYEGNSAWSYIMVMDATRTIVHQPQTKELSLDFVKQLKVENYRAAHFDVRHPEAAVFLSKECRDRGVHYSVDVERPREGLDEILEGASVVICNSNYCDLVLGDDSKTMAEDIVVKRLRQVFQEQAPKAKFVVMTMGSRGSCLILLAQSEEDDDLSEEEEIILGNEGNGDECKNEAQVIEKYGALWCKALKDCDVVDTTGAGDAFQGAFLTALWGHNMLETAKLVPTRKIILAHAMRIASTVAGRKVEKSGARDGIRRVDDDITISLFDALSQSVND